MLSRRRTFTLFVVLCLGHILLISAQVQSGQGRSVLHASAFGAVAAVQGGSAAVTRGAGGIWSHYFALVGVSRENEGLRARVLSLEGELQAERARTAETAALEEALSLKRSVIAPTLAARVIAGSPVPGTMTVTIDRGTSDGVTMNMAVISGSGVVGRIIGPITSHAAQVQLLIGRSANTGAMVEKTGDAGLAAGGFADGMLRFELLSSAATLAKGDRIVTSGQDGIYPRGFVIGQVNEIIGAGKAREIAIAPAVNFSHIDVVLVVLSRPAAEPAATPTPTPPAKGAGR
ncbi:MAG TPA: rod shape-determining protein MreC [Vicinamibacterales bacterium]|nr:rod shape-determining protein MreC [Vicinamibacterales bacterium]